MNLKEALKKAFAEKDIPLPKSSELRKGQGGRQGSSQEAKVIRSRPTGRPNIERKRATPASGSGTKNVRDSAIAASRVKLPTTPTARVVGPQADVNGRGKTPLIDVNVGADISCKVQLPKAQGLQLRPTDLRLGRRESIAGHENVEVRELSFGLDFGTSSVKVVIADLASDKAYAIPFLIGDGIESYLMPSCLYEAVAPRAQSSESQFSLSHGERVFRDLKLGLLGSPDDEGRQVEAIAFLSLIIRQARGWFFETYRGVYGRVRCLWQARIGLPSVSALNNSHVPVLERVLLAAWIAASSDAEITRSLVNGIRVDLLRGQKPPGAVEISVIPEIAAQVFGFVVSTSFDKKAENRFLMVDVGAGTVDSSLFRVLPAPGGYWSFEFYTAVVQPYGVSNLHANRVSWWEEVLAGKMGAAAALKQLGSTKYVTDVNALMPAFNRDYFAGIKFSGISPDDIDKTFFDSKLMAQVRGSTVWRAWKDQYLTQDQLNGIPMFLCGGGARGAYYARIAKELEHYPNFTWLRAKAWQLQKPSDLNAAGIDKADYDRLSVAYGLCKVNVASVTQALPPPKIPTDTQEAFSDRYIDKDQV